MADARSCSIGQGKILAKYPYTAYCKSFTVEKFCGPISKLQNFSSEIACAVGFGLVSRGQTTIFLRVPGLTGAYTTSDNHPVEKVAARVAVWL